MPTFSAITTGQVDADSPLDTTLARQWTDNLLAVITADASAPTIAMAALATYPFAQADIGAAAVGQSQLKNANGTVSTTTSTYANLTLPGGAWGFYPRIYTLGSVQVDWYLGYHATNGSYLCQIGIVSGNAYTKYANQHYIQASPPYDLGDGLIGQFVFALVDNGTGKIEAIYSAPEAPWHNNGPTDIRADFYDDNMRGWRKQEKKDTIWLPDGTFEINETKELIEITQDIKQADMPLIPHPFTQNNLVGKTVVLLDPVADMTWYLADMHEQGESPNALLHDDYLRIDNVALNRAGPPGVMVVPFKWRNT